MIVSLPEQKDKTEITGGFSKTGKSYAFEYKTGGKLFSLKVKALDVRYEKLVDYLSKNHFAVRISGDFLTAGFRIRKIRAGQSMESDSLKPVSGDLIKSMVERLRTSQIVIRDNENKKASAITRIPELRDYVWCMEDTLPDNIRDWAYSTLRLLDDDTIGADEKRHAQHALSLMMSVQWKTSFFEPIDPHEARQILDDELYGLEEVKQRVIETIIQINRTHTLPFYGLLLVGPAGTGKSQIAYAVAKILKMPWAVLDMSTVRDPSALTGSSRIYVNARTGRIMDAFVKAGSSNVVFVINELDKADSNTSNGNSADSLLTLFDNLGFTDNYMECAIPTNGVYPIATANDISKISGPLRSRFAVIEIPDYTPKEKKIIFRDYSLPKILKHLGMKPEECSLTESAVNSIIEHFHDTPGCRDLEQAAEHLASHALYEIEATGKKSIRFNEGQVNRILGFD
ncbi:MAG: AAA family ATPase [Lachnospiraceae bacterium]|nr:MAG: AAA family ATPase [Lachnospiraceae bacterium]